MPKKKSSQKALRRSLKRRIYNLRRKSKIKKASKELLSVIKQKNKNLAKEKLSLVYKQLDKAGKTFMHKNKVARLKSKFARKVNKITASAEV